MLERIRRGLLRVEASVAMMRLVFDVPFIVVAGWLAAGGDLDDRRLWFVALALILARGASNVINDILDREEDRSTKAWMPIPSGLVELGQALVTAAILAVGVASLTAAASYSPGAFTAALGLLALGGIVIVAHSLMPPGLVATVVSCTPFAMLALIGWTLAGGGGWAIVPVVAACWCYGAASRLQSAVRDFDSDGALGCRTIAVRYGPVRALVLAAACDTGAALAALAAAADQQRMVQATLVAVVALTATLSAYRRGWRAQPRLRGRFARVGSMRSLGMARYGILVTLVAAFSTVAAAVLFLGALLVLPILQQHERRVVGGALRRRLPA